MAGTRAPVDAAFKRWLTNAKLRRPKTAEQYAYSVRMVADHFTPRPLASLTTAELLDYTHSLPPSGGLRNGRRIALVAYFDFLGINPNPAKPLPSWKHTSRLPLALTAEEAVLLLKVAYDDSPFYGCLVSILLFTGLRISEVLSLKWAEVTDTHAYVIQKGGQQRIVFFNEECACDLMVWRAASPNTIHVFASPTLLKRGRDEPLPRQTAYNKLRAFGEEIGVSGLHPHTTRHTLGVDVARGTNGNIMAVMSVLGHASPQSSAPYIRALGLDIPNLLGNISYSRNQTT